MSIIRRILNKIPFIGKSPEDDISQDELNRLGGSGELDSLEEERDQELSKERRLAKVEETVQDVHQENKKLKKELKKRLEQASERPETAGTTATPPPDSDALKGKPVVPADGNDVFGKFVEFITEDGKWGIAARDVENPDRVKKVGYAEAYEDLFVDAYNLKNKEVLIVKFDSSLRHMDYVSVRRHQEILRKKERMEDEVKRLSQENDELIEQNKKKDRLNNKLISKVGMLKSQMAEGNGGVEKDVVLNKALNEMDMQKQQIENMSDQLQRRSGREKSIINQYEDAQNDYAERLGLGEETNISREFGDQVADVVSAFEKVMSQLPEEAQETVINNVFGSGTGGTINIKEDS